MLLRSRDLGASAPAPELGVVVAPAVSAEEEAAEEAAAGIAAGGEAEGDGSGVEEDCGGKP